MSPLRSPGMQAIAAILRIAGLKKPNAFGLYDMLGNASEWVLDRYYNKYDLEADAVGEHIDLPLAGNASAVAREDFGMRSYPGFAFRIARRCLTMKARRRLGCAAQTITGRWGRRQNAIAYPTYASELQAQGELNVALGSGLRAGDLAEVRIAQCIVGSAELRTYWRG